MSSDHVRIVTIRAALRSLLLLITPDTEEESGRRLAVPFT